MTVYQCLTFWSIMLNGNAARISMVDTFGQEYFSIIPNLGGRAFREARETALDALEAAIAAKLPPGEVKISMSIYQLVTNASAVQTITNVPAIDGSNGVATPAINQVVQPLTTSANNPTQSQGFEIVVKGSGNVSATATIVGSNDGINWSSTGVTVAATSATNISTGLSSSQNTPYAYFGAYISAISGTGAKASVTMSA